MDTRLSILVCNTLWLAASVCAASVLTGVGLGWLLLRSDLPGRRLGLALLGLMLFVPLYLQAAAWQAGFGQMGWYTLARAGGPWLEGWAGAIWIHALAALPWTTLIVGVGLRLVEPELEQQALLDGTPWQVFRRVTLRSAMPAVVLATLWVLMSTAGEMTVTDLFAIRTYAEELYTQVTLHQELTRAVLALLPGLAAGAVAMAILLWSASAVQHRPWTAQPPMVYHLGRWRWPLAAVAATVVLAVLAIPLGSLVVKAGMVVTPTEAGRVRTWSAAKCLSMIVGALWRCPRELGWSLLLGVLSATTAVVVAGPLVWLARRGRWQALPALVTTAVLLTLPGPLLGLMLIHLLNQPGVPWLGYLYDHSILAPWLALWLRGLPAAILCLWHGLRTLPPTVLETAATEGAGAWAVGWRIVVPLRWPAILVAWLIVLALSFAELGATILVVPPGVITLPIHIFGLLHYGVEDQVAGICLALVLLLALVAAAVAWLAARWHRQIESMTAIEDRGGLH